MTNRTTTTAEVHVIDVSESLSDITANIIHKSEYSLLPSDIFEDLVFTAINELVDDFAHNPHNYLKPHHEEEIDRIAHHYLNS